MLLSIAGTLATFSEDGGDTWHAAPTLTQPIAYRNPHWVVVDTFSVLTFNDMFGSLACSVLVYDRQMNLIRGSKIGPVEVRDWFTSLFVLGDTLIAAGDLSTCISTNVGVSWTSVHKPVLTAAYSVTRLKTGAIAGCGEDSVFVTPDNGATWRRDTSWPARTMWMFEWSDDTRIACVDGAQGIRLYVRYSDTAWAALDTIRFTNTERFLPSSSINHKVVWYDFRDGQLTMLFEDGDLISTRDTGRSWFDRGNIGSTPCGGRKVTETHDEHAIVATRLGLWRVPLRGQLAARLVAAGSYYGGGLQVDDTTYYAYRGYASVRSSDGGETWYCWYEPVSQGVLRGWPHGVSVCRASTVSAKDDSDIMVTQQFRRMLYNTKWTDRHWRLLSIDQLADAKDPSLGDQYISGRQLWNTSTGIYAMFGEDHERRLMFSSDNGLTFDSISTVPREHTHYCTTLGDELFIVDDSLRVMGNANWLNVGAGLPTDPAGVQHVKALARTNAGVTYAAMAGVRFIDTNGVSTDVGGGLFARGTSDNVWLRVPNVSEHDINVMHVHVTQTGAVLATMTVVTKESTLENLRQDDNVIVRSDDNGSSWQEVYHDVYGGPALMNPLRFVEDSKGTLYASRTRGAVLSSVDDGLTWQEVPNWNSSARINDMTVDTNDVLYVATDSAVIMVRPTTTDVSAEDNSMYLSLSLQPNPARLQTHIIIGNASKHTLQSLILVGTLGQATLDLTPQLLQQSHLKTARIDLDTSSLPVGTYIAALRAGTQTRHVVLCVMR